MLLKIIHTQITSVANVIVPPDEIKKKVNEVIAKYVDTSAIHVNKLIDGSSGWITHPYENYLIFEGRLTKADGTACVNADEVTLTNNATLHLLAELNITYPTSCLNPIPGQATTMLGLLK